tara:strand:- start:128 stop:1636 length:1509 start_codon:yes stop_codon:yes gene_type:complete
MVKGAKWCILGLCVLILISPIGAGEAVASDDPPQIIIDQGQGLIVDENLTISGTYVDEELPSVFSWRMYNGLEIIDEGDLQSSLTQTTHSVESSRTTWEYSVELNLSPYSPCSCLLEILATDTANQDDVAQLILFSQGEEMAELAPRIIMEGNLGKLTGTVSLNAFSLDDEGVVGAQWAITDDTEIAMSCIQSWIQSPESVVWNNITGVLTGPMASHSWWFDTTDYEDGEYSLIVRAVAEDGLTSPCACQTVGIDNHAPTAMIDGPSEVNESAGEIQFDGSGSSDRFWEREGLVYLWVLDGDPDGQIIESGSDCRTFDVDASQSGNFTLTLTVADSAGFSNSVVHQFNISNQDPEAVLRVGGQPLEDGDIITLADEEQWLIECGDSTDSENDQAGLVCTWYIDGEPVMTGMERQMQQPDDLSTSHTLMLEVADNDGSTDTITVTFGVQGTPSDPMYNGEEEGVEVWALMIIIAGILVSICLVIILIRSHGEHSSTIPKWKRE